VDDVLIRFAGEIHGFLREYERDRYILLFSQEELRRCEEERFSRLLDGVREIRLGEYSIPVTVSVGVSLSEGTMSERALEAESALDMALQRGGDQVAVRRRDGIRYYGGQNRPFRRRTKVQSRVVANFLLSKITEAENLLIMGHRNPDYDCIGSAIGVAQLGLFAGVPTKIVSNLADPNFRLATRRLITNPVYTDMFVSPHKGLDLVRPGTLLIIADANNFDIIESPDIAENVRKVSGKIAIIDHHMQTGEYGFEPVMNYIVSSASSACELVAEMLEQSEAGSDNDAHQMLNDEVASVMLSGIMLDTNSFTRNTGTRTLDAARYLYGKGANAERVSTFFNQSYDDYVRERSFSGCRLLHGNTVGLTWSEGTGYAADDRVAAAKEADRLLAVRGVRASFALIHVDDAVHISGRSDGSINVQLILERLGGGGRFDSAGAALTVTLEQAIEDLEAATDAYFKDLESAAKRAAASNENK
jgi:c-di-AMP phosphodiesterase-like protein